MTLAHWWLSFVDPDGPRFLGVVIVRAHSFPEAIRVSHLLGINPGGAVRGEPLDDTDGSWLEHTERLLSREELERIGAIATPREMMS
jgi:hypothetical protein